MKDMLLQIKNAVIKAIKRIDPEVDVYFEEIKHTDEAHGASLPETYYFFEIIPVGFETVDRFFTDMRVWIDVAYHEESESNTAYLMKAAELDDTFRPVLMLEQRNITIRNMDIKVVDHVLHCSFPVQFRIARREVELFEKMGELQVAYKESE